MNEWTAWLDSAADPRPFYTGTRQGAEDAALAHPRHDVAYIQAPDGETQYEWYQPKHPLTGKPMGDPYWQEI
jgi:hypothetical protein